MVYRRWGGEVYLAELLGIVSTSAGLDQHCRIIHDDYLRRSALDITRGVDKNASGNEILAEVSRRLRSLEEDTLDQRTDDRLFTTDHIDDIVSNLSDPAASHSRIFPSGITQLDDVIGGFRVGTITAVQGLYKTGKTKFVLSVLARHAKAGTPVGFLSLEMNEERVRNWFLSHFCRIDSRVFSNPANQKWEQILGGTGGMTCREDYVARIEAAKEEFAALPLHCSDIRRPSVDQVAAISARWARQGVKLIALDYFERMQTGEEWKDEGIITARLADIATRNNVAFIYVDQLNKSAEKSERPTLSDSRGSISRCADADLILQMRNLRRFSKGADSLVTSDHMADIQVLIVGRESVSGKIITLRADLSTGHFAGVDSG